MSLDEDTENFNSIAANNESVYISQRIQIIQEMVSNKQNEEKVKEFMEQQQKTIIDKIKFNHEKELMNSDMKKKLEKEMKLRDELVNLLSNSNTLMTNNIENSNLFGNVMQCCIDNNNKIDELKVDVADLFEKVRIQEYAEERKWVEKLNYLKDYFITLKENHRQNIENCYIMKNEHLQIINAQKQNIKIKNEKKTILDENDDKVNQEVENIQNEANVLLKKLTESDKTLQDIKNEKETKRNPHKQKLLNFESILSEKTDNYTKKEIEIVNFKDGLNWKTEYIKSLQNIMQKKDETVLEVKKYITEFDQNIQNLDIEFDKETENHDKEIETVTQETKKIEENVNNVHIFDKNISLELETLENKQKELNNQFKTIETSTLSTKKQSDHMQQLLEEQCLKFGVKIATMEKNLNDEITEEIGEEKDLEKIHEEMYKQHEEFILRNEGKITELEVEAVEAEMATNLTKDDLKIRKQKIEDSFNEISKLEHATKTQQEELEQDHDNRMKNLNSYFEKLKIKLKNGHQEDVNKKSEDLKKLKETGKTLELQVSELTVSTQILRNELDIKIKELKEMTQKLNNDQKEERENLKRNRVDFKIPKTKIPFSKYSSTSDDSADEKALLKRRKINFKRPTHKKSGCSQKSIDQQNTKKSIENILDSIHSGPSKRASRKRTIKKPVF